jgi:hypothetical protein
MVLLQMKACCFCAIANGVSIRMTQVMMSNCIAFILVLGLAQIRR